MTMPRLVKFPKRLLFVFGDVCAVLAANLLATSLRFDFDWSLIALRRTRNVELLALDLLITPIVFYLSGLYQGYWRYTSLVDLLKLGRAVTLRTITLIVMLYAFGFVGLSRAVLIMSTVLLVLMTGLWRLGPRFHSEYFTTRQRLAGSRTLIIGAGDTGESLLRELKKSPDEYNPVGFIDDDRDKAGVKIHGVPVLGGKTELARIVQEYGVREVIVAIPGATGKEMRQVFEICRRTGARLRTVPTRGELARGAARISQIRLVDLEDLLGREAINLDQQVLRQSLTGNRILVTGAAGSIGREMARQIASYEPETLILLDRNENNLFYLEAELREAHPLLDLEVIVGDVLDRKRMDRLFRELRPRVLLHASAYKHVPLMEQNPIEAIKNNVLATQYLVETAASYGVERFIYVSTDKAVQPSSVMGATKRLGERLIKSTASTRTRFMAVRFGNVLGSDGSVVPTFRKQIAAGGPVTVTHPEATRFFMTIPEAVQLVLMAGAMGEGGETFLLRMGNAVRIVDLAKNLIELSGLKPDVDVQVVFTGLRQGEKLHEVLQDASEEALPTPNEKIMVLTGVEPIGEAGRLQLRSLEEAAQEGLVEAALAALHLLVPDYHPRLPEPRTAATTPKIVEIGAKRRLDVAT